jgi:hypothetical protein
VWIQLLAVVGQAFAQSLLNARRLGQQRAHFLPQPQLQQAQRASFCCGASGALRKLFGKRVREHSKNGNTARGCSAFDNIGTFPDARLESRGADDVRKAETGRGRQGCMLACISAATSGG